jgi:hypothetical protein
MGGSSLDDGGARIMALKGAGHEQPRNVAAQSEIHLHRVLALLLGAMGLKKWIEQGLRRISSTAYPFPGALLSTTGRAGRARNLCRCLLVHRPSNVPPPWGGTGLHRHRPCLALRYEPLG